MENSIIVFCGIAAFMATNIGIRNFDKKRKNKLTLGSVIASPYANSLIKKQYTKLLNLIFEPNELNMRNNIAHINNENSDYLCLGDTAVLMQLLWDIITEDIFE